MPHFIGKLFTNQMPLYYTKELCCALFGIYHITGKRRKEKGSELQRKYIYYYGFTNNLIFNQDLAFIYKRYQAFIQYWP